MNNGILSSAGNSVLDNRTLGTVPLNGNILNSCVTPYNYPATNNQYDGYKNGNDYVVVIDTTVNNNLTINISLLLNNNPAKPLTIDWGDGSSGAFVPLTANAMSRFGTFETSLISIYSSNFATTHTYPRHGQYIVKFIGAAQNPVNPADVDLGLGFNCPNIVAVLSFGRENGLTRFTLIGNSNLTYVPDTPPPQHSGVYGGYNYGPFINCSKFNSPNVVKWDMSNTKSTLCMFQGCSVFDQDLSSWNTSNVTDMTSMFYQAFSFNNASNSGINNWNTSNVTSMNTMFLGTIKFNQPLNNWNVRKVTNFAGMFHSAGINSSLAGWQLGLDTAGASCSQMFQSNTSFNQPINDWNTSKVTNMTSMFQQSSFNQPIISWDTSNVTTMANMFAYMTANGFNQSLDGWNVRKVTTFANMFINDVNFNGSLSGWAPGADTAGTTCASMFNGATTFVGNGIDSWDTSKVTNMSSMFNGATKLGSGININLNSWNISGVTTFDSMFMNTSSNPSYINNINIDNWSFGSANLSYMFRNSQWKRNLSGWNVSKVTSMQGMFYGNYATITGSGLDTWNLAGLNSAGALDLFATTCSIPSGQYDLILNSWNTNKASGVNGVANWRTDLRPDFGSSKYTSAASGARASLVSYGWTITDGGVV